MPPAGLRRLQGYEPAQEDAHQPEQNVLPQAKRKLRRLPASHGRRDQAGQVHGIAALRRRVIPPPTVLRLLQD